MGRLWWAGPSIFHVMGRGPARPITILEDGPRPDPAHRIFFEISRPGPLDFQKCLPGPAHDIDGEAHETRALYGLVRHAVGRPVDLTGRATDWPMCCPVLKDEGTCADVLFRCTVLFFPLVSSFGIPWPSP